MRPVSDVAKALLQAACRLSAAGRGVTLAEMAAGACVGRQAARKTVANLKSRGQLRIVGERRVSYRNRPVAEYVPTEPAAEADQSHCALVECMSRWGR